MWVKFRTGDLNIIPLSSCQFRKNQSSETNTLQISANGVTLIPFDIYCAICVKFGVKDLQVMMKVSWKSVPGRPFFPYWGLYNYIYACTVKPDDTLNVCDARVLLYRVHGCSSCSYASRPAHPFMTCGQLRLNFVCLRATGNLIHKMKN